MMIWSLIESGKLEERMRETSNICRTPALKDSHCLPQFKTWSLSLQKCHIPAVPGSSVDLQPVSPAQTWPPQPFVSPSPVALPLPSLSSSPAPAPGLDESVPPVLKEHILKWSPGVIGSHSGTEIALEMMGQMDEDKLVPFWARMVWSSICLSLSMSSSFSRSILSFSFSACSRFFFSFSSWALRNVSVQINTPLHNNTQNCIFRLICPVATTISVGFDRN